MPDITIREVAKICGVAVSTVSRAINNHSDINPQTKQRILDVIKEQNYIPNNSARNLKRTETKTIAVLVKGVSNPFFNRMLKIMEDAITKHRYAMILHYVKLDEDEAEVALELVKEKRLSGIIFLGGFFKPTDSKLKKLTIPVVLSTIGGVSATLAKSEYSSVSVDDRKESRRVVDYLLQSGHRKIAIISAPQEDMSIGRLRLEGYLEALTNARITLDTELISYMEKDSVEYSMENGYQATKRLLTRKKGFTALFAVSDSLAIGACRAILESGGKIPEEYTVIGYDGIEMGNYYYPALTTLVQPIEAIALETVRLLFEMLEKKIPHQHMVFEGYLEIRESSRIID